MGKMPGLRQVSAYVEPALYDQIKIVAVKTNRPMYKVVNDALRAEVEKCVPSSERKVLDSFTNGKGKKKGGKDANRTHRSR